MHSPYLRLAGLAGLFVLLSCTTSRGELTTNLSPVEVAKDELTPQSNPESDPEFQNPYEELSTPIQPETPSIRSLPPSLTAPLPVYAQEWIENTIESLSLRDRVAQLVMIWVLGDYTSETDSSFETAIERVELDKVGGVVMSLGSPIEVAAKINALQARADIPLLIASDVEPGLGRLEGGVFAPGSYRGGDATVLPSAMAIGATRNVQHARTAGRITGVESRAIGIHVAFAPTVDVNNNPRNPVTNVRSFGEDTRAVAQMSAAFVEGVQEFGVAATVKHFPGHGDTDVDSHLALPIVGASRARLDTLELLPFRATIAAGAAAVMSAHIALPAISGDSTPATLVPAIMSGLLRDTLGFGGVTFTDAMDMRGVGQGYGVEESSVLAIQAGSDVLLMPPDIPTAISAIVAAVERGELSENKVNASVRRILELKLRTGAIQQPIRSLDTLRAEVGTARNRAAAQRIANDAITLLRNDRNALPFTTDAPTLILTFGGENDITAGRVFTSELRSVITRSRAVRITPTVSRARLDSLVRPNERIVIGTFVRTIEGEGRFAVGEHVARWIDSLASRRPVTVVAFSNPYVIREFPGISGYVAAYGRGEAMERAAARAITGRQPFTGSSPISLPGFFAVNSGIVTGSVPQRPTIATVSDSIRRVLERSVRDSVFPGAIAVIGNSSGILAEVSAGRIDWAADSPIPDPHTIWDLASLTKVVGMTTAMMQLVEDGRVGLDAPVQRYIPEWQGQWKHLVTVRHLLTHSAGLIPFRQLWKEVPDAASARQLLLDTPLENRPGTRMVYSDIGAILAGIIIERVSGETLDAYLERNVFNPLDMRDTRFLPPADWQERVAPTERDPWRGRHLRGEVHDENAHFLGGVSAHAGLFSSSSDLVRFARMMLNGGELGGVRILKTETIRDFTRVQNTLLSHRALGWETPNGTNSAGRLMRRPAYGHTGFTGTSLWIDPRNDRFVILLTNRVNPTRENSRIGPVRTTVADLATEFVGVGVEGTQP